MDPMSCMGGAMSWMSGAWGIGMMLILLVFWVAAIAGIVVVARWLIGPRSASGSDSALEIVRQRYARGEINREDFEARKHDLQER